MTKIVFQVRDERKIINSGWIHRTRRTTIQSVGTKIWIEKGLKRRTRPKTWRDTREEATLFRLRNELPLTSKSESESESSVAIFVLRCRFLTGKWRGKVSRMVKVSECGALRQGAWLEEGKGVLGERKGGNESVSWICAEPLLEFFSVLLRQWNNLGSILPMLTRDERIVTIESLLILESIDPCRTNRAISAAWELNPWRQGVCPYFYTTLFRSSVSLKWRTSCSLMYLQWANTKLYYIQSSPPSAFHSLDLNHPLDS